MKKILLTISAVTCIFAANNDYTAFQSQFANNYNNYQHQTKNEF